MNIKHLRLLETPNGRPRANKARGVLYLYTLIFLSFFISAFTLSAQEKRVSLITVWPGSEIYELCGHEAVRITGPDFDEVWNFGLFDFAEPNFVYRFVKGETDYMVGSYSFPIFMTEYINAGRRVEEQVLNITPEEADSLHKLLIRATTPPNNRYRYNYIKNNCSTQIADLLDSISGGDIVYPQDNRFSTYRDAMRAYHANYPWYQFGIDVALGNGLEEKLSARKELFIPVEFHRLAANAKLPDGRPLIRQTNVLNEGTPDAVKGPTPFLLTPLWFSIVIAALSVILIVLAWRDNCIPKWWYAFYFGLAGLAGCLVAFLVCVSSHAATSPNLLIFWLNPLQLLVPVCLWWPLMKPALKALMWLNVAAVGMLLVLMPLFDRGQAGQTSFLILMAADLILAVYYLYADNKGKTSAESANDAENKLKKKKRLSFKRK